jgi:hypothetical protein
MRREFSAIHQLECHLIPGSIIAIQLTSHSNQSNLEGLVWRRIIELFPLCSPRQFLVELLAP